MRKFNVLLLLVFLMCMASNAGALPTQVYLETTGGSIGGAFNVFNAESNAFMFQSFCLESRTYFRPGQTYYASFDPWAMSGGTGGQDQLGKDTLGMEAAWIYQTWLNGPPVGWTDLKVSQTIWHYEGEVDGFDHDLIPETVTDDDMMKALAKTQVMNLWTTYENGVFSGDVQSQMAPVPEPATVFLIGAGLVGLAGIGRKKLVRS